MEDESEIRGFFRGKTVFVTGGTGFLGKLLVEKLLRACPDLKKMYLLVREKKKRTGDERLKELFALPAFDLLKRKNPNFLSKISLCHGDCALPFLGLSPDDQKTLKDEVNCVLHCAATVLFDVDLRKTAYINVRAVKDLLALAKEMKQLKSFIHVSTAYSQCPKKEIDEIFYEPPITAQILLNLVEMKDESILDAITPTLLGDWPNTYTYTKAIAESLIENEVNNLPIAIVRPSIVCASYREPAPGWLDSIYGPNGILLGVGAGFIRVVLCDKEIIVDIIPADFVINTIIAAAWQTSKKYTHNQLIYNSVSFAQNPIQLSYFWDISMRYGDEIPTPRAIWHVFAIPTKSMFLFLLYDFLFHNIPSYLADGVIYLSGRKTLVVKLYKKFSKFFYVGSYFTTNEWKFKDENTRALWQQMGRADRELFGFDMANLNWDDYMRVYVRGVREFLFKDPMKTLPEGKKKQFRMKVAHYTIVSLLLLLLFYIVLAIFFL